VGYSIGKWIDANGDGKYTTLEVETRYLRGPRAYEASGIPFHEDNQTVIKERFYLDKLDRNMLYDEITVIDHAMTRGPTAKSRRPSASTILARCGCWRPARRTTFGSRSATRFTFLTRPMGS
jgi:hypothetical protein